MSAAGKNNTSTPASHGWSASPFGAWFLRFLVVAIPVVAGWGSVRLLSSVLYRPSGSFGFAAWIGQACIIGVTTSLLAERATRRLLPLAALLNMSLVFPDQSPSRFGIALRSGTLRQQKRKLEGIRSEGLSSVENEAAEQAIELVTQLGKHDRLTRGHTERVRAYSDLIADEMKLSESDRQMLAWGSMLHDIGKMAVREDILNKPGRPTEEEWTILQKHPAAGQALLAPLEGWLGEWAGAAGEHHEKWDGSGYPNGLAGTDISLAGRITAVADAYDVITSRRSYKEPTPAAEAREELVRCSGTQFDPDVVRAFLNVSLKRRLRVGPLAWLAELPQLMQSVAAIPSAIATTTVVAGSVMVGSIAAPQLPDTLAFVQPEPATSTVPLPTTPPITVSIPTESETASLTIIPTTAEPELVEQTTLPATTDLTTTTTATTLSSTTTNSSTTSPPTTSPPPTTLPTTGPPTTPLITTTTQLTTTTSATTVPPTTLPTTTTTAAPTIQLSADSASVDEEQDKNIKVLENDDHGGSGFDDATLSITIAPLWAESYRVHNDHIHYEAPEDRSGSDYLQYRICNNDGECATADVSITLSGDD